MSHSENEGIPILGHIHLDKLGFMAPINREINLRENIKTEQWDMRARIWQIQGET